MRSVPRTLWFACLLAGSAFCVSVGHAQCPVNTGQINRLIGCPVQTSSAPTFSYGAYCYTGSGTISYDLIRGFIYADASAGYEGIENFMQTSDDFVIDGPAGGSAITISAILDCTFTNCADLRLYSGTSRDSLPPEPFGSHSVRLKIVIQHPVGEHFPIGMYALACAVGYFSSAQGTLGFTALPPGYTLRSCQGYSGSAVPTRVASWGQIKAHYR